MNDLKTLYDACSDKDKLAQIANQDYIKIFAPAGRKPQNDANALATLVKAAENGTIFDVIFGDMADGKPDYQYRVLSFLKSDGFVVYVNDSGIENIGIFYTLDQYQGLAAVQAESDRLDGVRDLLPAFTTFNGLLVESVSEYSVCTPDGYQYKVTLADNKIATIEVSTTKIDGDVIVISIEDAQKLIGLHCG